MLWTLLDNRTFALLPPLLLDVCKRRSQPRFGRAR